jgi:hypothetical protein
MGRAQIQLTANQTKSIVSKYNKGVGLVALATEFEHSIPVIRRVLSENKVKVRGRGRPVTVA